MQDNVFLKRVTNIEYSRLAGFAGNSELHFRKAAEDGFDGLKADMRLTSDGEIVLCHDPGYTFDAKGRITDFNKDSCREIHSMKLADVLALEFDIPDEEGAYYHPCTLNTMLGICEEYHLIPYLTNRHEDWREETAHRMAELLKEHHLTDRAVMNLYAGDPRTLSSARKEIKNVPACDTKHREDIFSRAMIDDTAEAGYQILCLCHMSESPVTEELIRYAEGKNVAVWEWGMTSPEDVKKYLELGVKGFQMYTREVTNRMIRSWGF